MELKLKIAIKGSYDTKVYLKLPTDHKLFSLK